MSDLPTTAPDLAKQISTAISDMFAGRITPRELRETGRRAGAILKAAETELKYREIAQWIEGRKGAS